MTHTTRLLSCLMLLLATNARAQNAPQPPVRSPEVSADGRVTVRLRAPAAQAVLFMRDGAAAVPMQRDSSGVWSYTTPPLEPDFYPYVFIVDGVGIPDPRNSALKPVFKIGPGQSVLHVPGPSSLSWEWNDVPHGVLHHHFYHSQIIGDDRDYYVYTPPNYDARRPQAYPVLYLMHGLSDDATGWINGGRANVILDNLIARRKAEPMLVVMTLGYGAPDMMDGFYWGESIDSTTWQRNTLRFDSSLVREVMPQVERAYHVSPSREKRAIAGLSMGGQQALYSGLNHLDRFAYIGAFSSATMILGQPYERWYPAANAQAGARLKLLWIGIGKDDGLLQENLRFTDWLKSRGVRFEWTESTGGHTWMNWRRYLTTFVPLLFSEE